MVLLCDALSLSLSLLATDRKGGRSTALKPNKWSGTIETEKNSNFRGYYVYFTRRFGTLTKPETLYPEFFVTITLMCGLIDTKNSKGVMDDQWLLMLHQGKVDSNVICILKSYTPSTRWSLTVSWALQFAHMYLNVSPFITPLVSLQLWVLTEKRMGVYFPITVLKTSPVKGWSQ